VSDRLTEEGLRGALRDIDAGALRSVRIDLTGEASIILAGARAWTDHPVVYATPDEDAVAIETAVAAIRSPVPWVRESPADVVPLPAGHAERARPAKNWTAERLAVFHFDPYSVALRAIARGDEPDYHIVLGYLRLGWMTLEEMDRMLEELLPRFSSKTLAQDPAEFRRKFKGMRQMWKADEARRGHGRLIAQDTPPGDTLRG
jgi:hypothetical protein